MEKRFDKSHCRMTFVKYPSTVARYYSASASSYLLNIIPFSIQFFTDLHFISIFFFCVCVRLFTLLIFSLGCVICLQRCRVGDFFFSFPSFSIFFFSGRWEGFTILSGWSMRASVCIQMASRLTSSSPLLSSLRHNKYIHWGRGRIRGEGGGGRGGGIVPSELLRFHLVAWVGSKVEK